MKFYLLRSMCSTLLEAARVPVFMLLAKTCLEISLQQPQELSFLAAGSLGDHPFYRTPY